VNEEINVVVVRNTSDTGKQRIIRSESSYRVAGCPSGKGSLRKRLGTGK